MEQKSRSNVAQEEGKWQDGKEAAPSFPTVLIALVVVRKEDDLFLCNHEHDGWYFPAGRVDYGESFATGAVREALEEAGVPVILDGVLRIEHTPGLRNCRMRVIFQAHAADDTPPKSIPDEEVIEAKWLTIPELEAKRLRSTGMLHFFCSCLLLCLCLGLSDKHRGGGNLQMGVPRSAGAPHERHPRKGQRDGVSCGGADQPQVQDRGGGEGPQRPVPRCEEGSVGG
ncbi:NUDIX hydrolase [Balamuthia mandrillaris]